MKKWAKQTGFTIVELLIVIVIIAILAAITIVAYNGIQNRAKDSSLSSTASQMGKKVLAFAPLNTDMYPLEASYRTDASIPADSDAATYDYYVSDDRKSFCLSVSNMTATPFTGYAMTQNGQVVPGKCIKNIVKNPTGSGAGSAAGAGVSESSGWYTTNGLTDTSGVSWNGKTNWHRFNGTSGNRRLYMDLANLENGATYTTSVLVGNPTASVRSFGFDFSDQSSTSISVAVNEQKVINLTTFRSLYDSVYRFLDIGTTTSTDGLLVSNTMIVKGSVQYAFNDGSAPNWSWVGTPNNSASFGPALPQ